MPSPGMQAPTKLTAVKASIPYVQAQARIKSLVEAMAISCMVMQAMTTSMVNPATIFCREGWIRIPSVADLVQMRYMATRGLIPCMVTRMRISSMGEPKVIPCRVVPGTMSSTAKVATIFCMGVAETMPSMVVQILTPFTST